MAEAEEINSDNSYNEFVHKDDFETRAVGIAEEVEEDPRNPISDTVFAPDHGRHCTRSRFSNCPASDIVSIAELWEELAEMSATLLARHEKEAMRNMSIPLINIFGDGKVVPIDYDNLVQQGIISRKEHFDENVLQEADQYI